MHELKKINKSASKQLLKLFLPAKYECMSELNLRVANFLKMLSMLMVLGSLLYFYAYVDQRMGFITESDDWYISLSKSVVFYTGLAFFAVFNLLMNAALNMYKRADGYDENSLIFKSEFQKENIQFWMIYLTAGINVLISCMILYLAMIRINEVSSDTDYLYLPIFGLTIMVVIVIGLFRAINKKS